MGHIMVIFALCTLCGLLTSFLIPETKRKTLEELAGEVPPSPASSNGKKIMV
jgi:PHS family inorganic phosphate transporter-like MFS transporter